MRIPEPFQKYKPVATFADFEALIAMSKRIEKLSAMARVAEYVETLSDYEGLIADLDARLETLREAQADALHPSPADEENE